MGFGISSAISGAQAREYELEVLANNLANVDTTGYKEMSIQFEAEIEKNLEIGEESFENIETQVKKGKTYVNHNQGSLNKTNNPLDFAIQGDGFFEVSTPHGIRYTRNGNFTLNSNGIIVTANGHPVQSSNGQITIDPGKDIIVTADGQIQSEGETIGSFRIVNFTDPQQLKPEGQNYYSAANANAAEENNYVVVQKHLESSNVNLVENITRIIMVSRTYEAHQKSIAKQMEAVKLLNQLAKLG